MFSLFKLTFNDDLVYNLGFCIELTSSVAAYLHANQLCKSL